MLINVKEAQRLRDSYTMKQLVESASDAIRQAAGLGKSSIVVDYCNMSTALQKELESNDYIVYVDGANFKVSW